MERTLELAAFDLGGTELKAARIGVDGSVRRFARVPSRAMEGEGPLLAAIAAAAAEIGAADSPAVAGLGAPGVIHPVTGSILDRTPNVNLPADFPMRDALERVLGRRGVIDNGANAAA